MNCVFIFCFVGPWLLAELWVTRSSGWRQTKSPPVPFLRKSLFELCSGNQRGIVKTIFASRVPVADVTLWRKWRFWCSRPPPPPVHLGLNEFFVSVGRKLARHRKRFKSFLPEFLIYRTWVPTTTATTTTTSRESRCQDLKQLPPRILCTQKQLRLNTTQSLSLKRL